MFETVIAAGYLVIAGMVDLVCRKVYWISSLAVGIAGIVYHIWVWESWMSCTVGTVLCLLLFAVSWITKEGLGYGDILCILVCSIWMKTDAWLCMVFLAFFGSAFVSLFLLTVLRRKRKARIAFVPFLTMGYFLQLVASAFL